MLMGSVFALSQNTPAWVFMDNSHPPLAARAMASSRFPTEDVVLAEIIGCENNIIHSGLNSCFYELRAPGMGGHTDELSPSSFFFIEKSLDKRLILGILGPSLNCADQKRGIHVFQTQSLPDSDRISP